MDKSRRDFLTKLGATVGVITIGRNIMEAMPSTSDYFQKEGLPVKSGNITIDVADFRYSPKEWQSTYCFPDDPYKSLVGKYGQLLYGHEGIGHDEKVFPHVVSVGLSGMEQLTYIEQKLESASIPIITTKLDGGNVIVSLISFATKNEDEGRVDNLWIEIIPKDMQGVQSSPEIIIKSNAKFNVTPEADYSAVSFVDNGKIFLAADSTIQLRIGEGVHRLQLKTGEATQTEPAKYFVRFPQEGQEFKKIADGLEKPEKLLKQTRAFWQNWKPTDGKVAWSLDDTYQNFLTACARNIQQAREVKNGKKLFQVGPTVYRGLWIVDGNFLLEAARYLGYDKEAQEGLESIWDRQDQTGLFSAGAGEAHWKDTAVAVYALIRQAELSQNWSYFNELYPDAYKAVMALKDLRDKAKNDGSSNGKYHLLPKGFGDSGIGGIREEFTNSLWTIIALKLFKDTALRLGLDKATNLRDFFGEMWFDFIKASLEELKTHPKGFSYLPMLMKSDPKWQESDERKQPRPQAAQIYLSHSIYPGLLFKKGDTIVNGHVELMKAVTKEDIPGETGWLSNNAVWSYNAAIVAQVYLWLGMPDLARKTFVGFLNHASPLYAWREEQSLQDSPIFDYIGDMPHNWASAECVRYLRHMMILEDEKNLLLFQGIGLPEMNSRKLLSLVDSPTRWGRISVSIEPADSKTWITKFKRENFDKETSPLIEYVIMPRRIGGTIGFSGATGAKSVTNGDQVLIRAEQTVWECKWKSY